jgi:hypothetical protein
LSKTGGTVLEWADRILKRPRTAFEYGKRKVARKNKERKAVQMFAPRFEEKDMLFVWENTKEETRLREDIKDTRGGSRQN